MTKSSPLFSLAAVCLLFSMAHAAEPPAADAAREFARPAVDLTPDALVVEARDISRLLVMNVRVYNEAGELVRSERSMGEIVLILPDGLPDGRYSYESVIVNGEDDPEQVQTLRRHGEFEIIDGLFSEDTEGRARVPEEGWDRGRAMGLLGRLLDLLVPSAAAADVTVSSALPTIWFDDTDANTGSDFILSLSEAEQQFVFEDQVTVGVQFPLIIKMSANNANAFDVRPDGDVSIGDGRLWVERSTGDVGIGTTNPDSSLYISTGVPRITLFNENTANKAAVIYNAGILALEGNSLQNVIWFRGTAPGNSLFVESNGDLSLANNKFFFDKAAGAFNSERLGIGTTTPADKIHISDFIPAIRLTDENSGESAQIKYDTNTLSFSSPVTPSNVRIMWMQTGAPANSLVIPASGNVGFGLLSPAEAVDVQRSNAASRFQLTSFTNEGSEAAQFIQRRARGSSGAPGAMQSGDNLGLISFRGHTGSAFSGTKAGITAKATENWTNTANGSRLLFQTTQNGTTGLNTVLELTHDGKVLVNGVALNVPDYVFEEDYPLMALDDLAAYIGQYKHLPGVAPAQEVNREGLDLAGSQMNLLEKIEELTLYTLQQHEALRGLQRLRERNARLRTLHRQILGRQQQLVALMHGHPAAPTEHQAGLAVAP